MPLATDQQWVKTYGKLPWWRGAADFRGRLKQFVKGSTSPRGKDYISDWSEEEHRREDDGKFSLMDGERDGVLAHIHSIVAQYPDWSAEQVKATLRRRLRRQDQKSVQLHQDQEYQFDTSRDLTVAEKKVDFVKIQSQLDLLEVQSKERIRKILTGVQEKLLALISRKLQEKALTTKFINDLELRGLGQLIPTLREILGTAFRMGRRDAAGELKQEKKKFHSRNGGAYLYQVRHTLEGLPPEKALEFFDSKATLWGANIRDPLLSDVKGVLYDAIKIGSPLRDVQANLFDVFLPWLGDSDQQVDDLTLTPYRLETMVRTNTIEALNEGRKAQFQPAIESGFIIGLQFSAILDARTTEVCRYLDKLIFRPSSSELDRLTPPRNYSCRSIWIPVTRDEGPVQYITQSQVAKGIELSGKGFSECCGKVRSYDWPEEDHSREDNGKFAPVGGFFNVKSADAIRAYHLMRNRTIEVGINDADTDEGD